MAPEQLALARHCTHLFVAGSQTGIAGKQVELSVHCTQAPPGAQTGCAGSTAAHWVEAVQATQVPVLSEQMGVPAGQLALVTHPTHVPVAEHRGREGSARAEHCDDAVQGPHVPARQMGVPPGQVALAKHCTQRLASVSQTAFVPEQVELSMHWTHVPAGEHAAWVGSPRPTHCAAVLQPAHSPPAEQIGDVAGQAALLSH